MAIRGSLREASLPDVLQLLSMGRKTGCLSVTHKQAFGSIYFEHGRVAFASIVNRRDRLGDVLVSAGQISREDLDRAIAQQAHTPEKKVGELLVLMGLVSREELHQHIRRQIEEAVYHLFTWSQGTFSFEPDVLADEQDFVVSINPESLLLEGARRVDEWSLIEKKVPGFDSVFTLDRGHLAETPVELTPEQETLVELIDGLRDVQGLVEVSGLGEFDVGKALFGLATAGFIHRVGRRRPVETPSPDTRVTEHRNLGVAFYKSGMFDEAGREFRRVLELRSDDEGAAAHLGLLAVRERRYDDAITAFRALVARNGGRATLHANLAVALERAGRLEEARKAIETALALAPAHPRIRLQAAAIALNLGDVRGAASFLRDVRGDGSRAVPAPWYHLSSLLAALQGDLDHAIAIAEEGLAAHPHAAALASNLAVMLERAGRAPESLPHLERAAADGVHLPQVHKNIGDAHHAAGQAAEALESYARAVRLDPDLGPDVWQQLGNLRTARGEAEDAGRCWQRARLLAARQGGAFSSLAASA